MKYRTLVFGTSINDDNDVRRIAGLLDGNGRIRKWSVDLEDWEKVLRIECCGLSADTVSRLLRRYGYECYELEYLLNEMLRLGMLAKALAVLSLLALLAMPCRAQVITDSLADDFRALAAKNFSRYRTVNLFWETKWAHDYNLTLDGKDVEKRRKKNLHTLRFSTMVPMLNLKNISLYANLQYSRYTLQTYGGKPFVFGRFAKGGLSACGRCSFGL